MSQILQLEEIEPLEVQKGESRRVGYVAALGGGEVKELGVAGGVLAAADLLAQLSRRKIQPLEDRIEQRGLSRAGCARHGGDLASKGGVGELGECLHALPRVAGQNEGAVAHLLIEGGDLSCPLGGKLGLAHHDDGLDAVELQDGEQLVHRGNIGIGGGGGDDHQHGIQVGQGRADEAVFAGEDIVDHQSRAVGGGGGHPVGQGEGGVVVLHRHQVSHQGSHLLVAEGTAGAALHRLPRQGRVGTASIQADGVESARHFYDTSRLGVGHENTSFFS